MRCEWSRARWLGKWLITCSIAIFCASVGTLEARGEGGCRRDCPLSQRGPDGCCPEGPRRGQLEVVSQPAGATVHLDGRPTPQGKATPTTLSLRPKTYRIEVRLEGYQPTEKQVRVNPGGRHRVELSLTPLPGRLEIASNPSGATIFIDGRRQDEETSTPATVQLEPGEHIVELRLEGFESLSREITVDPGGQHEIVVGLVPEAESAATPVVSTTSSQDPLETSTRESPSEEREPRWRGWPWVLLGAGLGVGAIGGVLDIISFVQSRRTEPTQSMDDFHHWQDLVRNTALAGDILLWTGVAAAVGGLIWLLLSRRRERQSGSSPSDVEDDSVLSSEPLTFRPGML